jgi:hypothetical protein
MTGGPISGPTHPLQGSFRAWLPRIALIVSLAIDRSLLVSLTVRFPGAETYDVITDTSTCYEQISSDYRTEVVTC